MTKYYPNVKRLLIYFLKERFWPDLSANGGDFRMASVTSVTCSSARDLVYFGGSRGGEISLRRVAVHALRLVRT